MGRVHAYVWTVTATAIAVLVWQASLVTEVPPIGDLVFWAALIAAAELLPVSLGFGTEVTMAFPLHLATAIVFRNQPFFAMAIAGLAAIDIREFKRAIPLHRALFNRALIMLSVGAATVPIALYGSDPTDNFLGLLLIGVGATLHLITNLGLLVVAVSLADRISVAVAFQSLLPRPVTGFVISYALLTAFGVGTAIADDIGKWAVAAILLPLLFARASIIGARNQQQLAERVQAQQKELLVGTERIFKEREAERHRIAADIHDSSLQALAAAAYGSGNALEFLKSGDLERTREAMLASRRGIDEAMSALRTALVDLRRSSLDEGGLMQSLERFAEQVSTLWGAEIRLEGTIATEPPIPVSLAALQIVQEGVTNALKHAQGKPVVVKVSEDDGVVRVDVEDEGSGFDPSSVVDPAHVGMHLMRERASSVGGDLRFESTASGGTRVSAILPAGTS